MLIKCSFQRCTVEEADDSRVRTVWRGTFSIILALNKFWKHPSSWFQLRDKLWTYTELESYVTCFWARHLERAEKQEIDSLVTDWVERIGYSSNKLKYPDAWFPAKVPEVIVTKTQYKEAKQICKSLFRKLDKILKSHHLVWNAMLLFVFWFVCAVCVNIAVF